ncbi:MAG: NAD(P)/FAD-dependent oxidoreductase [Solirubrobacterales bacterium]
MAAAADARAVIVGAGHNGLVAANYLADAGVAVTVVERRDIVGGACVTEELIPGFKASSCAFVAGPGLEAQIMRDLDLDRFGLELYQSDPLALNIGRSGRSFAIHTELDQTLGGIEARFGRRECERFVLFGARLQRVAAIVRPALLCDAPSLEELRGAFQEAGDGELFDAFLLGSVGDLLDAHFTEDELKGLLAFLGLTSVYGGPYTAGTAYVYSHHSWGDFAGKFGEFGYARGGMGAISEALASRARAAGVEIRTEAEVTRILVQDGRAAGVVLAGGEEIRASLVVSNADPKRTYLGLMDPADLDSEFRARIDGLDFRGTMARVHIAVESLPRFTGFEGTVQPPHQAMTILGADVDSLVRAADAQRDGTFIDDPCVELTIQSVHDETLVAGSGHIITTGIQQLPFELASGSWDDARDRLTEQALSALERYAPGTRATVIGTRAITPLDLERDYGLTGGNLFHGAMFPGQIFSARPLPGQDRYRAPIASLYLCGAGTHPGGGVTGAPGHNGARAVLGDLGMRFSGSSGTWQAPPPGGPFSRLGRLVERPRLLKAATALSRRRWTRTLADRARSH